jgi:hypothetical protein
VRSSLSHRRFLKSDSSLGNDASFWKASEGHRACEAKRGLFITCAMRASHQRRDGQKARVRREVDDHLPTHACVSSESPPLHHTKQKESVNVSGQAASKGVPVMCCSWQQVSRIRLVRIDREEGGDEGNGKSRRVC